MQRDPLTDGYQLLAEAHLQEMRRLGLPLVLEGSEGGARGQALPQSNYLGALWLLLTAASWSMMGLRVVGCTDHAS